MKTSKNILTDNELGLVSLLMQNCQTTGDIQSKLNKECSQPTTTQISKYFYASFGSCMFSV